MPISTGSLLHVVEGQAGLFSLPSRQGQPAAAPVPHDMGIEPDTHLRSPRALQVLDCYLVVEEPPDGVLFIDQHALHERILFEQMQGRLRSCRACWSMNSTPSGGSSTTK